MAEFTDGKSSRKKLFHEICDFSNLIGNLVKDEMVRIFNESYKQAESEQRAMCDSCIHKVSKEDIDALQETLAHGIKERFNAEFPMNYPSTKPFFTLENARMIVDDVLAEQIKGEEQ